MAEVTETPDLIIIETDDLEPPIGFRWDTRYQQWPLCRVQGDPHEGDCDCERVPVDVGPDTRMITTRGYLNFLASHRPAPDG